MLKMYKTELFELEFLENSCLLKYKNRPLLKGCDKVLNLFLELPISTPKIIENLGLLEDEENELENMLRLAILDDGNCLTI